MDYRNAAVEHPTAVDLQNSRQRCMTKLLALLGLGLYLWENNGAWDSTEEAAPEPKAKTPKKAKAKAKPAEEEPEQNLVSLRKKLSERCKELYANDWEADEALQGRIKKAVKDGDVTEMEILLKTLDDMNPALLTLHKE
jgi:hypothetical protein